MSKLSCPSAPLSTACVNSASRTPAATSSPSPSRSRHRSTELARASATWPSQGKVLSLRTNPCTIQGTSTSRFDSPHAQIYSCGHLRGLLTICASCKKVHAENGSWQQIESYIRDRSEVEFTHTMCPECALIWYPDHFQK